MSDNFEEQFLLMVVPYDKSFDGYYPSSHPKGGQLIPVEPIPNADVWIKAVREDLKKISQTKVGNLLLRSIKYHGKVITIRPIRADYCNSVTWEGVTTHSKDNLQIGTGADIQFNPETYKIGGTCETKHLQMGGFHIESHETLLHELVHAFRKVSGKLSITGVGKGLSFYGNNEEFNAVLVQGIYASERRTPVRSSHFHHFEIDKELSGSLKFFQTSSEAFYYVEKFCLENPGFTKGFINVDAGFNPINAYYNDKELAKQFSRSATAKRRDMAMPILKATINFLREHL